MYRSHINYHYYYGKLANPILALVMMKKHCPRILWLFNLNDLLEVGISIKEISQHMMTELILKIKSTFSKNFKILYKVGIVRSVYDSFKRTNADHDTQANNY